MNCPPGADNTIGPQYCDGFDFTLLFEQSILQIAPCALLLCIIPLRTSKLRRQSVKTVRTATRSVKQTAIAVLVATQLALLITWSLTPTFRTRASIPASLLSFLASLGLLYLSSLEHARTIRPSPTINAYILFSLLFDIPQARTLWLRNESRAIPAVFTAGMVAKAIILYLEARTKKGSLLAPYRLYAPEALVSLYDRTMLWWINPLFFIGYKSTISFENLYDVDSDLRSARLERNFSANWEKSSHRKGRTLLWTIARTLWSTLIQMIVPRLCLSAFRLSQPLLISRLTAWMSNNDDNINNGRGLVGATVLIYLGLAISNVMFHRQMDRLNTQIRGIIISIVHTKSLSLSHEQLSDGAALTFVSNDVNRICLSLKLADQFFATPFEAGVAIYLLERQIGITCLAPLLFVLTIAGISFISSNTAVPMQKKWLAAVQERVSYTSAVLGCPKGFKMLGLTEYLSSRIQALRVKELVEYAEFRKYITYRNALGGSTESFGNPITLITFTLVYGGGALTPNVAFTALSLVALMIQPIENLIHAVPMVQTGLASLDRIQAFLLLESNPLLTLEPKVTTESSRTDRTGDIELTSISVSHNKGGSPDPILRLADASVSTGAEKKKILDNVSASVLSNTLTFVVGPVGSGKSTLLRAMIGDFALSDGFRILQNTKQEFGFCSQDPWLPNATVREIVIGESKEDETWYSTVVQACALRLDILSFPNEDQTVIGTKGVSLSGGQRQRLALARALYARKSLLVLDDILSGLDARSSKHIMDQVMGSNGICKKYGIAVVMATHAVQHLHQADHIIALGEGGRVIEQGTFDTLCLRPGYVNSLRLKGDSEKTEGQTQDTTIAKEPVIARKAENDAQQELARRTGDTAVYGYYARSIGWKYGIIIMLSPIIESFGRKFSELWIQWWADSEVSSHPRPLSLWICIIVLLAVISVVANFTHIWVMLVWTVPRSSAKLHHQLLTTVMNAPYHFFVNTDSGVTLNRFANDMALIEQQLAGAMLQFMGGAATALGSAMLIAAGAKYVGLTMPFLLFVLYLLQKFYLRTSRQLRFMDLEAQAPLLTQCQETLSGITTIRAFGWRHYSHRTCLALLDRSQRPYYLMLCIQRWLNLVLDLLTAALAICVVAMAVSMRGTASAGSVGLSLLNILSFNFQLSYLIIAWTTLETSLGAIARCKNFENSTPSEHLPAETEKPPLMWPSRGAMTLDNVTAAYTPDGPSVLHNISLSIPAGTKVGICGRSGSGKSSLILTLLRLIDPSSGRMTIDGVDLSTLPRATVRSQLTAIPQETLAVPGSVRVNLDPEMKHEAAEAESALRRVGLWDLVNSRGGLEAEMGGLGLSQGELQMFAVARALLRRSRVLVVDEMTSAVDAATEERMLDLIREAFGQGTVLAVAHRLKTIVNFDMIIVMDQGRIAEIGEPKKLIEKGAGVFYDMWKRDS